VISPPILSRQATTDGKRDPWPSWVLDKPNQSAEVLKNRVSESSALMPIAVSETRTRTAGFAIRFGQSKIVDQFSGQG